jgi:hypothetical protein
VGGGRESEERERKGKGRECEREDRKYYSKPSLPQKSIHGTCPVDLSVFVCFFMPSPSHSHPSLWSSHFF